MIHYKDKMRYLNDTIEKYIYEPIRTTQPILYEIVKHALDGGKRLRSVITLTVAEAVNPDLNLDKLALCVELLHNASLIVDDMPCMDNDKYRRGKETVHFKFGIMKAQSLASYFLEKAYNFLNEISLELKELQDTEEKKNTMNKLICDIYDTLNNNMGFLGAATGQFIDICPMSDILKKENYEKYYYSVDKLLDLIYLKTTTFFEIGFVPAYLFASNRLYSEDELVKLRKMIKYFGLAFQISDDFDDIEQDSKRVKSEYNPNIVCKYGKEESYKIYKNALEQFLKLSCELNIEHVVFKELCNFLNVRVNS